MEKLSTAYFRDLLESNVKALKSCCSEWEESMSDLSIPEEVRDEIRTTIGLTNLLLNQKLSQFSGLVDDSEFKRGEKEITPLDLQGFWDMVYNEVEKIMKSFKKLENSRNNEWVLENEVDSEPETKKKPKTLASTAKLVANTKSHAIAARQRLAEAKLKMRAQMAKKQTAPAEQTSDSPSSLVNGGAEERAPQMIKEEEPVSRQQEEPRTLKESKNVKVPPLPKSGASEKKSAKATAKQPQKRQNKKPGKENASTQKERDTKSKPQAQTAKSSSGKKRPVKTDTMPYQMETRSAAKRRLLMEEEAAKK